MDANFIEFHRYECGHCIEKPVPDNCPICENAELKRRYEELDVRHAKLHARKLALRNRAYELKAGAAVMCEALKVAHHDLVTSHNLLATDRPDLVKLNNIITREHGVQPMVTASGENIMWMTDNSKGIHAIEFALAAYKEER